MASAIESISEVSKIVRSINDAQSAIAVAVEEQTETTNQIASGAESAVRSSHNVALSMADVSSAASQTQQGSETTYRAARELAEIASRMGELVSTFRV